MGDVKLFRRKAKPPIPPKSLTPAERAEWDRMVSALESVGMRSKVSARRLTAVVRRHQRLLASHRGFMSISPLVRRLNLIAKRVRPSDGAAVSQAARFLEDYQLVLAQRNLRLWDAQRRFLNAHRMSPRARMERD